jgi:hypothetical protein
MGKGIFFACPVTLPELFSERKGVIYTRCDATKNVRAFTSALNRQKEDLRQAVRSKAPNGKSLTH